MSDLLSIDGVQMQQYGLIVGDTPDINDGMFRDLPTGKVPGREGELHLSLNGSTRARRLTVAGSVVAGKGATSHADMLDFIDELKWRIEGREVEIILADRSTRHFTGRLETPSSTTIAPSQRQRGVYINWVFFCEDPRCYETTQTVVTFTSSAAQCSLGNAKVRPLIEIVGPVTDPIVIYKDAGGTEQGRTSITGTVPSGITLAINSDTGLITLDGADAADMLVSTTDFIVLDPKHSTNRAGPFPTLELSPTPNSAQATYRRAWS